MGKTNVEVAAEAARLTEKFINDSSPTAAGVEYVSAMLNMHRTLRQAYVSAVIIPFVREMAERFANGNFDGRDRIACEVCSEMWGAVAKKYGLKPTDPFRLPCI